MNRPDHIPIHRAENNRQPYYQRRNTVRYYAHRVKESLTTRVSKFICTIFLFILFVAGLIVFILWLSLRPHRPRFHIEDFTIPALTASIAPPQSTGVNFNVTIRNPNQKVIVHYDSIECAVYYRDQQIGGAPLVTSAFDQESKNTTVIGASGPTLTMNTQRWGEMQRDVAAGNVPFRLEITSVIKFEIMSWDTKRHRMHANCITTLGSDGSLLPKLRDTRCPVYFT